MNLNKEFPSHIRNIIFDLGNVLIDLDIRRTLRAFAALGLTDLDTDDIHPHQKGFFLEYELGKIPTASFLERIALSCPQAAPNQIRAAWNAMLDDPAPDRFSLLAELRKKYRIYALSNTNEAHIDHIRKRFLQTVGGRFDDRFDRCFYSHELGLRKPDEKIYRRVTEIAGIGPDETLFIDDNACNFPGALACGLHVQHLTEKNGIFNLFTTEM